MYFNVVYINAEKELFTGKEEQKIEFKFKCRGPEDGTFEFITERTEVIQEDGVCRLRIQQILKNGN